MGQVIHASGRRLERLVENFLIYAQIELMGDDPQKVTALRSKRTLNAAQVIKDRAMNHAAAAQRSDDLVLEVVDIPLPISEEYFGKIVEELVQNAFKFSDSGTRVHVSLSATPTGSTFVVVDHGRGFSTEHLTKVGAYMQFDRKMREQQGLGLGLVISKRLTELHGGTLAIQSIKGANTTVTVRLPM